MFVSKLMSTVLVSIAVASAGAAGLFFSGQAPEPPSTAKIACLDIMKVLNEHNGLKEENDKLKQLALDKQGDLDVMKAEIDKILDEMSMYARGSVEYTAREYEVERKKLHLEQQMKLMQRQLSSTRDDAVKAAILDVEKAIDAYSRANGIDVVITTPYSVEDLKKSDPGQIVKWLDTVHVLWCHDSLDISDAVITIVNGS